MSERKGVIYPLHQEMVERAVNEGRDVFAKFGSRNIKSGMALYIYGSGENADRKIVARAEITDTERLPASDAWSSYGERLFPDKDEFNDYIRGRRSKQLLILELDDLQLLDDPVDSPGYMSVAGLYVDEEMQEEIENQL